MADTIADKLAYLGETKALIKNAITEKGVDMSDDPTFRTYPERVAEISSGGYDPTNPQEVYDNTRPKDWLPLTPDEEFPDNRIEMLFLIPDGSLGRLAFTLYTSRPDGYIVSLNGQEYATYSSSVTAELTLNADDYGDLTSDGYKQVLVSIEPAQSPYNNVIARFLNMMHSRVSGRANWRVVDMKMKLTSATVVQLYANNQMASWQYKPQLRYFSWLGTNNITSMSYFFGSIFTLKAVLNMDTSKATSAGYVFNQCYDLQAIPKMNLDKVTSSAGFISSTRITDVDLSLPATQSIGSILSNCYYLKTVKLRNLGKVESTGSAFQRTPIEKVELEGWAARYYDRTFQDAYNFKELENLDVSKTSTSNAFMETFYNCPNFRRLTFAPVTTAWAGYPISIVNCAFERQDLVEMFETLPTPTNTTTLTITGNPGVADLTDDDKAIATGKNWSLVV